VIEPTIKIVEVLKEKYPHIPIIAFPKGSGYHYEDYLKFINFDILAVDQTIPNICMHNWQRSKIVQGNLDPLVLLLNDKNIIKDKVDNIFKDLDRNKFIFNLGHGVLPTTPLDNVNFLIDYVQEKFII
jgi:uroporphyrinogen decarboxylase